MTELSRHRTRRSTSSPLVAVDDDRVGLRRRRSLPPGVRGEVDVHLRDAGAREIVDGDRVGAAQGVEVDPLDAVEVHRDAADVAGEADPAAVGRDVDLLGDVGAVEGSVSSPAWPSTVSLPSPGFQTNVSSPAPRSAVSLPRPPVIDVVAVAAEQTVVAVAAGDRVVARAAVDREADQRGQAVAGGDDVVAAVGVDDEVFGGADVEGERGGADAVEADPRCRSP